MKDVYRERLQREQIFTIPNLMSFFRILLIPVIVVLYCVFGLHLWAGLVVLVSAATDVLDGKIARKFGMTSDLGKFLDPLADKLTQAAMLCCLISEYFIVIPLIVFLLVKEIFQFVCGLRILQKHNRMDSSRWFGKVSTAVFYAAMLSLFLFPDIPFWVAVVLVAVCFGFMLVSFIGYARFYLRVYRECRATQNRSEDPGTVS